VDRRHLRRGQADALDVEASQRVGDCDDPRARAREAALDVAERADTERIVVVLRRDEPRAREPRGGAAVDVGVDEVRVHDVRPDAPQLAGQTHE